MGLVAVDLLACPQIVKLGGVLGLPLLELVSEIVKEPCKHSVGLVHGEARHLIREVQVYAKDEGGVVDPCHGIERV